MCAWCVSVVCFTDCCSFFSSFIIVYCLVFIVLCLSNWRTRWKRSNQTTNKFKLEIEKKNVSSVWTLKNKTKQKPMSVGVCSLSIRWPLQQTQRPQLTFSARHLTEKKEKSTKWKKFWMTPLDCFAGELSPFLSTFFLFYFSLVWLPQKKNKQQRKLCCNEILQSFACVPFLSNIFACSLCHLPGLHFFWFWTVCNEKQSWSEWLLINFP